MGKWYALPGSIDRRFYLSKIAKESQSKIRILVEKINKKIKLDLDQWGTISKFIKCKKIIREKRKIKRTTTIDLGIVSHDLMR
jgi:hypothetical protein